MWDAEIAPQMTRLIKNPATACERERAIIAPVLFSRCYAFPAGDKRSGAKMMQGIEFIIIKLPASFHESSLISGSRDHFPKQGVIFFLCRRCRQADDTPSVPDISLLLTVIPAPDLLPPEYRSS